MAYAGFMYRLLDLFCGAGGAARGYQAAGFHVTGVDIRPQPSYPAGARFIRDDAIRILEEEPDFAASFHAIHASPPCQAFSVAAAGSRRQRHLNLVDVTRDLLNDTLLPWVIENVPGAPLQHPVLLCGASWGLPVIRHRLFEATFEIPEPACPGNGDATAASSTSHPGGPYYPYASGSWEAGWRDVVVPEVFPGMTLEEAGQAIPPQYAFHVGQALLSYLRVLNLEAV